VPNSFSYRHPETGEWAHNLTANIDDDVCKTYVDPIWDKLLSRDLSHLRVLEVGFGRGYNCAELIKRVEASDELSISIVGLEPCPEILHPWPTRPSQWHIPWWGDAVGEYEGSNGKWKLDIRPLSAQHPEAFAGEPYNAFIVDLFSLKLHPEHWQEPFVENMSAAAAPGAVLSSYSCARAFRDELCRYGWHPQVLRRAGWRDTLVAVFDG
jgi:hypothetical protein